MSEEKLEEAALEIETKITPALRKNRMTQVKLAEQLNINTQQLNIAIHGDPRPTSKEIRQQIYKMFDIK